MDDARLKGGCDGAAATRSTTQRARQAARRQVEIRMVEEVVELAPELNLQALERSAEPFVESDVRLVERRGASRVPCCVAERAQGRRRRPCWRQSEGVEIDVLNVERIGPIPALKLLHRVSASV